MYLAELLGKGTKYLQTGFPKPVHITHYGLIANIALNQNKPGFSTLPVFHGYGHFAVYVYNSPVFPCLISVQFSMHVPWPLHYPLPAAFAAHRDQYLCSHR